jgi:integrase
MTPDSSTKEARLLMPKLTKKFIDNKIHPPDHGQIIFRDTELRGFALRVTRGSMSYVTEYRVNGIRRRVTIGPHGPLSPEVARREAQKLLAAAATGHDPRVEEANRRIAAVTLADVLERYLSTRELRPNSVRSFEQLLRRCLGDWLQIPIASITRDMVVSRHRELTKVTRFGTPGKAQANLAMERLGILINFAAINYEVDGQPLLRSNPVKKLSQLRAWHKMTRRQTIIPDHKLGSWYRAVLSSQNKTLRDYLLILLFTGLRKNEAATLRWSDIDLEDKVLTVRAEVAKNHREHRLPLSDFLFGLLARRRANAGGSDSDYVFPGRGGRHHIVDAGHMVLQLGEKIGCRFVLHDLRRVFLTTAEKLDIPHYALKKLANHVSSNDVTAGYIVIDVERLRDHMSKISHHFGSLLGVNEGDLA